MTPHPRSSPTLGNHIGSRASEQAASGAEEKPRCLLSARALHIRRGFLWDYRAWSRSSLDQMLLRGSLPSWAILRWAKSAFLFIIHQNERNQKAGARSTRSDSRTRVPAATGAITTTETRPHQLFISRRCKQKFPQLARGTPAENLSVPKFFEQKPKSNIPPSHPNTLLPQKNHWFLKRLIFLKKHYLLWPS